MAVEPVRSGTRRCCNCETICEKVIPLLQTMRGRSDVRAATEPIRLVFILFFFFVFLPLNTRLTVFSLQNINGLKVSIHKKKKKEEWPAALRCIWGELSLISIAFLSSPDSTTST